MGSPVEGLQWTNGRELVAVSDTVTKL